jgi:hypothetical protein
LNPFFDLVRIDEGTLTLMLIKIALVNEIVERLTDGHARYGRDFVEFVLTVYLVAVLKIFARNLFFDIVSDDVIDRRLYSFCGFYLFFRNITKRAACVLVLV